MQMIGKFLMNAILLIKGNQRNLKKVTRKELETVEKFPPFSMLSHGNLLEASNVTTFILVIVLKGVENY